MIIFSYLLYYGFIIPISLLPFRVLYAFSDFLFLVLYRMVGYRRKVVQMNLKNSFPAKTADELQTIEKLFYKHFCDVIVETFKSFTISKEEILKRMILRNPELTDQYFAQGRSVLLGGGHFNNWEWFGVAIDMQVKHKSYALYAPLRNKFFDNKMRSTRGKYGLGMISVKETAQFFEEKKDELTLTVFGIDQSPRNSKKAHWMNFLHQDTGVMYGLEKYARDLDYPVVFGNIEKVKRGYYSFYFEPITEHPRQEPEHFIIEATTKRLEMEIFHEPQYWLWTHKRWKRKREPATV
jgi:Kdo2-lipid IVA lauroyltransferase/acyltransferase